MTAAGNRLGGEPRVEGRRRLLMLAYFFPPLGGAGVQRSLKFARYLPGEGWDPTVVTVRSQDYWMADATLAAEIGPAIEVIRTASLTGLTLLRRLAPRQSGRSGAPRGSTRTIGRLRALSGWVLVPDSYVGWTPYARRAALDAHRRQPFDAIYTTSSPDSAHLAGRALARRLRVPWVADFRDPWIRRLSYRPPTPWHDAWQRRLERAVLAEAALITVTAEETRRDYLERYPALPPEKIQVVTNGFDEVDFTGLESERPAGERLQILHAGQLNPERPARPLLLALRGLIDRDPPARDRLRVRFVGACYGRDVADARALGLADVVVFEPGCPHREVITQMLRSHVLLLMEKDDERGGLILPGKIFEYLRARRPILGLLPHGAAWRLIEESHAGRCCRTEDVAGASRLLGEFLAEFARGGPPSTALAPQDLERFERRALTRRLAGMLTALVGD